MASPNHIWAGLNTVTELAKQTDLNSLKSSVSSGKAQIASAITDKGVSTSSTASFSTMASNISKIKGLDPVSGTRITSSSWKYSQRATRGTNTVNSAAAYGEFSARFIGDGANYQFYIDPRGVFVNILYGSSLERIQIFISGETVDLGYTCEGYITISGTLITLYAKAGINYIGSIDWYK